LKRENEEIVNEKQFDDYMSFMADSDKWARYFRVQRMISHLSKVERDKSRIDEALVEVAEEAGTLLTIEESSVHVMETPDVTSTHPHLAEATIQVEIVNTQTGLQTGQRPHSEGDDCHTISMDAIKSIEVSQPTPYKRDF
jgi:hypothetical protein